MKLSSRENTIRNLTFNGPQWMPCHVLISEATWGELGNDLEDVVVRYPSLFPGFKKGMRDYENMEYPPGYGGEGDHTDAWGCVWERKIKGIEGVVKKHPLANWEDLEDYSPPDPEEFWDSALKQGLVPKPEDAKKAKENGHFLQGSTEHGFYFLRMQYIRGFENLMIDMATDEPRLKKLGKMIEDYTRGLLYKWFELDAELINFAEDLGMQTSSIVSPDTFKNWVSPAYKNLMGLCHEKGIYVGLHSDGYIMNLMDELIDCGVDRINPQDLVNGIDNLNKEVKGRVCIQLDIDRQSVVPYGSRKDIHDLIEEEVKKLGSSQGGLEMIAGIYPPTPCENIDALCHALEKYRTYWFS